MIARAKEKDAIRKAMAPVARTHKAVAAVTKRGVQRLENAIGTLSAPFAPPKAQPSTALAASRAPYGALTMGSSMEISPDLLQSAEEVVLNSRRKQAILVGILIKLQAECRGFLVRKHVERRLSKISNTCSGGPSSSMPSDLEREKERQAAAAAARAAKRTANAAVRIQTAFRCNASRQKYLRVLYAVTQIAATARGRRVRLAYLLVQRAVARVQALSRAVAVRSKISTILSQRFEVYKHCIFVLWREASTPLSYRTKFWELLQKPGFLVLSLEVSELRRLWSGLSMEETTQLDASTLRNVDRTMNLAVSLGLSNELYLTAKEVCFAELRIRY